MKLSKLMAALSHALDIAEGQQFMRDLK